MPSAPAFWNTDGAIARMLAPFSPITRSLTARRVSRPSWTAPVPVICCGNVTVGGAGKTTLTIDLMRRLTRMGERPHALLRGYRGSSTSVRRVAEYDNAGIVGDEALLLAAEGPTWIGADRGASGQAAVAAGASVLVMDDGLQNATLRKTMSLLVIDGATGFGNGRLLPAGPLREDVATGAARCHAAVLIGADETKALARLPPRLPVMRVHLAQDASILALRGRRVVAFAGIARPSKFFSPLAAAGAIIAEAIPFPDHHPFSAVELARLRARAAAHDAELVTTPKDAVRLPPAMRACVTVVGVSLAWDTPGVLETLLREAMHQTTRPSTGAAAHP